MCTSQRQSATHRPPLPPKAVHAAPHFSRLFNGRRTSPEALTCAVPGGGHGVPLAPPGPRPAAEGRRRPAHPRALRGAWPDCRAGASVGGAARTRPRRAEGGADLAGALGPEGAKSRSGKSRSRALRRRCSQSLPLRPPGSSPDQVFSVSSTCEPHLCHWVRPSVVGVHVVLLQ